MRFHSNHFKMKTRLIRFVILFVGLFAIQSVKAQEIKCDVRINSNQIAGTDKTVFESLQTALYEFINNTRWTDINFKTNEKIECSIAINIKERTDNNFSGDINMVLRRPTYKATYTTTIFNNIDSHFLFSYMDGEALDFSTTSFNSDLTATIGFYIYMFLGYEFDTFSLYGGENFYKIAENIVNMAQNTDEAGWVSTKNRQNRYWLCENVTNSVYQPLRQFLYEYHRLGLDVMSEKPEEGRAAITKTLEYLQAIHATYPTCYYLQVILDTKRDEIINVYSQGSQQEKTRVANILKEIDPSQATAYDAILQNNGKY